MKPQWKIPLDRFGGVVHYVYPHRRNSIVKWVDGDTTWTLELQLKGCDQGRSSVWFNFVNVKDKDQVFPFNVKMLIDMLNKVAMINGRVLGTFGVRKHGVSYSMQFLGLENWDAKM